MLQRWLFKNTYYYCYLNGVVTQKSYPYRGIADKGFHPKQRDEILFRN